jgi:hypothetical protein
MQESFFTYNRSIIDTPYWISLESLTIKNEINKTKIPLLCLNDKLKLISTILLSKNKIYMTPKILYYIGNNNIHVLLDKHTRYIQNINLVICVWQVIRGSSIINLNLFNNAIYYVTHTDHHYIHYSNTFKSYMTNTRYNPPLDPKLI